MTKIVFNGWKVGMRKVELSKLLSNEITISLDEAKEIVDKILDNEIQIVQVENLEKAIKLSKKASAIGAICEIING